MKKQVKDRKENKDNFLLMQAHKIVTENAGNQASRERKKNRNQAKLIDFLHHMNRKKEIKKDDSFEPPFKL